MWNLCFSRVGGPYLGKKSGSAFLALIHAMSAAAVVLMAAPAYAQDPPRPPSMISIDGQSGSIHDFTGLPLTSDGWTDFEAMLSAPGYSDARVVFVSSSEGRDETAKNYGVGDIQFDEHGMFQPRGEVLPFRTLTAAYAQIRRGYPDILLLRRGDEWSESFSTGAAGRVKSGLSQRERHIIASYGSGDRPALFASIIDARDASYTVVAGLRSYSSDWRTSGRALDITGSVNHQLYEDMRFEQRAEDKIQGGTPGVSDIFNVAIRRSIYSHYQAHDGFMYVARVDGLLLEENVFSEPWAKGYPDETRHGRHLYLSPSGAGDDKHALNNVILRGNLFFRGERGAVDARAGGLIENNLFLQNNILATGGAGGSGGSIQSVHVVENVFMQGAPNVSGSNYVQLRGIDGGSVIGNVWTDARQTAAVNTILITGSDDAQIARNIEISRNIIYGYRQASEGARAVDIGGGFTEIKNIRITDNEWQYVTGSAEIVRHRDWVGSDGDRFRPFTYRNNKYFSTSSTGIFMPGDTYDGWVSESREEGSEFKRVEYPDPDRTIDRYMTMRGLDGGAEEFVAIATRQSRHNWNQAFTAGEVNNYIRAGFGR